MQTGPTITAEGDTRAVALYFRVSTDEQETHRQERPASEYAARAFPGAEQIVVREKGSAFKESVFEREGGKKLVRLIESGAVRAVVADAQDRFSRGELLEWAAFQALCVKSGVEMHTVDGGEIRADFGGEALGALRSLLAHDESRTKSHRAKSGRQSLAERGYWHGGQYPFGLTATGERRSLILAPKSEAHAAAILRAFELYDEGENLSTVGAYLTEQTGEEVSLQLARKLLSNPHYAGFIVLNGQRYAGNHDALIPDALYWRVQHRIDKTRGKKPKPARVSALAGLIRCECGSPVHFERKAGTYNYYACDACKRRVTAAYVETALVLGLHIFAVTMKEALADPTFADTPTDNTAALIHVEDELAAVEEAVERVVSLIADGTLRKEDAQGKLGDLYAQRDALEQSRGRLAPQKPYARVELEAVLERLAPLHDNIPSTGHALHYWRKAGLEEKQKLLAANLESIELRDDSAILTFAGFGGLQLTEPVRTGKRDTAVVAALEGLGLGCHPFSVSDIEARQHSLKGH